MIYRGLRFAVAAGRILLVLGFAMSVVLEEYNLPASIELSLVDLFVVTLTSLVLAKRDSTEKA